MRTREFVHEGEVYCLAAPGFDPPAGFKAIPTTEASAVLTSWLADPGRPTRGPSEAIDWLRTTPDHSDGHWLRDRLEHELRLDGLRLCRLRRNRPAVDHQLVITDLVDLGGDALGVDDDGQWPDLDEARGLPLAASTEAACSEELVRETVHVVELVDFVDGAVVVPADLGAIAAAHRHLGGSSDRWLVTGHGALAASRATSTRLLLTGPREAWASHAAERLCLAEQRSILAWAAERFGWDCDPDDHDEVGALTGLRDGFEARFGRPVPDDTHEGLAGPATLAACFDCYDDALAQMLGGDPAGHRARASERLAYAVPPALPPPPSEPLDPLYCYGTDRPPRGGRPEHFPFLRCTIDAQVYPVKLAQQATGDANDYVRSLDPLNPHLCVHGSWSLRVHDEINLPPQYAAGLRDFIVREHYEIHLAPPEPAPAPAVRDANVIDCGVAHLDGPYAGAPHRRANPRKVEIVLVPPHAIPPAGRVCRGAEQPCGRDSCTLYDPCLYELVYLVPLAPSLGVSLVVTVVTERDESVVPAASVRLSSGSAALGDETGRAYFDGLCEGAITLEVEHDGHHLGVESLTLVPGANACIVRLVAKPRALWRLEDAPAPVPGEVSSRVGSSLAVRILDQAASPLGEAVVELGGPCSARATTGADGQVRFAGLPAGSYWLVARCDGFLVGERAVLVEASEPAVGAAPSRDAEVELALSRGAELDVVVAHVAPWPYDEHDVAPIAGARVLRDGVPSSMDSDDRGRTSLVLPPGKSHLEVSRSGFATGVIERTLTTGERQSACVRLEINASPEQRRQWIVELARKEALRWEVSGGNRVAWSRLDEYFRVVVMPGDVRWTQPITLALRPGQGLPHWCGIFAVWLVQQAARPGLYWKTWQKDQPSGPMVAKQALPLRRDLQALLPGDILRINDPPDRVANHHCVLLEQRGDALVTAEGNTVADPSSDTLEVRILHRRRSDVTYYYRGVES